MQHTALLSQRNPLTDVISSTQSGMITSQPILGGNVGVGVGVPGPGTGTGSIASTIGISDVKPRLYDEVIFKYSFDYFF